MQSILSTGRSKSERATPNAPPFQATGPSLPFLNGDTYKLAFTVKQAARASGLSRSSIYLAIRNGELRARKYRARTVITDTDLRRFLRNLPALAGGNAASDAARPR